MRFHDRLTAAWAGALCGLALLAVAVAFALAEHCPDELRAMCTPASAARAAADAGFTALRVNTRGPSRFCRGLLSIEITALHSHGLDFHSRVLLCDSMTGDNVTVAVIWLR